MFALTRLEPDGGREHDLAARERAWDAAAAQVARWFAEHPGGTAAFATIGDPCIYSTFSYLAAGVRELVEDLEIQLVPGITAMQDLAARSGTPLVEGREALALFPMTAGAERFREALDRGDAVVAYKFGRMLPEALAVLRETGRLDGAVYGAGLGLPRRGHPSGRGAGSRPARPVPVDADRAAGTQRPRRCAVSPDGGVAVAMSLADAVARIEPVDPGAAAIGRRAARTG